MFTIGFAAQAIFSVTATRVCHLLRAPLWVRQSPRSAWLSRSKTLVATIVISIMLMMVFAASVGQPVCAHPSVKVRALALLVVVGVALIADSFVHHVPKGYVNFALAFSVGVEMLNIRAWRGKVVKLREGHVKDEP